MNCSTHRYVCHLGHRARVSSQRALAWCKIVRSCLQRTAVRCKPTLTFLCSLFSSFLNSFIVGAKCEILRNHHQETVHTTHTNHRFRLVACYCLVWTRCALCWTIKMPWFSAEIVVFFAQLRAPRSTRYVRSAAAVRNLRWKLQPSFDGAHRVAR